MEQDSNNQMPCFLNLENIYDLVIAEQHKERQSVHTSAPHSPADFLQMPLPGRVLLEQLI